MCYLLLTFTSQAQSTELFDYDAPKLVSFAATDTFAADTHLELSVSFPSPVLGHVPARVYKPVAPGSYPGLVIAHGIPGSHHTVSEIARAYAQSGVAVLALSLPQVRHDLPYREPRLVPAPLMTEKDRDEIIHAVVDTRHAFDVLRVISDVDTSRIGVVGHSFGAYVAGLAASVDPRFSGAALMAPSNGWASYLTLHSARHFVRREFDKKPAGERQEYLAMLRPLDLSRWIGRADGEQLLVQVATNDHTVLASDTQIAIDVAPTGTRIEAYPSDHLMNREAFMDQAAFFGALWGMTIERFEPPGEVR